MKNTANNYQAAATKLGVPVELISICFDRDADGCNANGTVNCEKLQAYIDTNKDELDKELESVIGDDSIAFYKKENLKIKNRIDLLKEKELKREILPPDEVKQMLIALGTAVTSIMNKLDEIPPKASGKSEPEIKILTDKIKLDILNAFKAKELEI